MKKNQIIEGIVNPGIAVIIRANSSKQLIAAIGALVKGGLRCIEVTMTTPNALSVISEAIVEYGDQIIMGVGSVLDTETANAALLAGAQFVVTPVVRPEVIRLCNRYGKPIMSGAYTPTEILTAYELGSDFVKVFPANQLGAGYIKDVLAPLPMLQLIPTGGVTYENATTFLKAGCVALGVGSSLVSKTILEKEDWTTLTEKAGAFLTTVQNFKNAAASEK